MLEQKESQAGRGGKTVLKPKMEELEEAGVEHSPELPAFYS